MAQTTAAEFLHASFTGGPFVSGTRHKVLQLGQRITAAHFRVDDVRKRFRMGEEGAEGPRFKSRRLLGIGPELKGDQPVRRPFKMGSITVRDIIDAGLIQAGKDVVKVTYKGVTYTANLDADGSIEWEGRRFAAASAFSVHVKRLLTPHKQGDDGWKSVYCQGAPLDDWRHELYNMMVAQQEAEGRGEEGEDGEDGGAPGGEGAEGAAAPSPAQPTGALVASPLKKASPGQQPASGAKAKGSQGRKSTTPAAPTPAAALPPQPAAVPAASAAGAAEETDQWVQCSRCEAWRKVPDDFWEEIQNDEDEDWCCRDAQWDITLLEPFTPACTS